MEDETHSTKQTILIVDDNLTNILLLNNLLRYDYIIQKAQSGAECLEIANSSTQPDLILLDIMMPYMNGYDVCLELKKNPDTVNIPVIFVTAKTEESDEEYGLKIGAVDYITKPISPLIVLARIKNQLILQKQNKQLIKNEALLKAILDNSPLLISTKDLVGNVKTANRQFELLEGKDPNEYIGRHISSIYLQDYHDKLIETENNALRQRVEIEEQLKHSDGTLHTYLSTKFPIHDLENKLIGTGTISADITTRKAIEQSLRQAKKMEAIGQLTGGIAHDFNNILGIILGNSELLHSSKNLSEKDHKRLSNICKAANRAAYLTSQLLGFSRFKPMKSQVTDLKTKIEEMDELLTRALTQQIKITKQFDPHLWHSLLDPSDLQDALLNLMLNARDAMPNGGEITLELHNTLLDEQFCALNNGVSPGEYVELIIKDTGEGIPESIIDSIFNPFFTTKSIGNGTGLGLSMVFGFVKRSQGYIKVISKVSVGTEFHLYFPNANKPINETHLIENSKKKYSKGTETLLIVDDEEALLETTKDMLTTQGYHVLTATNGNDALELLNKESKIDLIISDIIMPDGINGYQLMEKCQNQFPDIKILLCSGFTQPNQLEKTKLDVKHLLKKPFTLEQISSKIREVLVS